MSNLRTILPPIFRRTSWPHPEASIGDWLSQMGAYNCWEATGPAREQWIKLAGDIQQHLECCHNPFPKGVIWSAYMIGRTKQNAVPTVVFCSPDPCSRRQARKAIVASGILEGYPGFRTADCSRPPDFDRLIPLGGEEHGTRNLLWESMSLDEPTARFESYSGTRKSYYGYTSFLAPRDEEHDKKTVLEKPAGPRSVPTDTVLPHGVASKWTWISPRAIRFFRSLDPSKQVCFLEYTSDGILRRATVSARIKIFNDTFLLTVGHIFSDSYPMQDWPSGIETTPDLEFDIDEEDDAQILDEESIALTSEGSLSPPSQRSRSSSETQTSSVQGRRKGSGESVLSVSPTAGSNSPCLTPPLSGRYSQSSGLPPAPSYQPPIQEPRLQHHPKLPLQQEEWKNRESPISMQDRMIDATSQRKLPSKGGPSHHAIFRQKFTPIWLGSEAEVMLPAKFSLDYALIKAPDDVLDTLHLPLLDWTPGDMPRQPRRRAVHVVTSGNPLNGTLSDIPTYISHECAPRATELWTIRTDSLNSKIEQGDCGAMVFCSETGELFGHVVAGSPDSGTAYILPTYQVYDDIRSRLQRNNVAGYTSTRLQGSLPVSPSQPDSCPPPPEWILDRGRNLYFFHETVNNVYIYQDGTTVNPQTVDPQPVNPTTVNPKSDHSHKDNPSADNPPTDYLPTYNTSPGYSRILNPQTVPPPSHTVPTPYSQPSYGQSSYSHPHTANPYTVNPHAVNPHTVNPHTVDPYLAGPHTRKWI